MEYQLVNALIDLDAIACNIRSLKQITHPDSHFMAVVKADAYGHGAVKVAKTALKNGADWLGVARLEEAVELRNAGITAPILIFGYVYPDQMDTITGLDLVTTVFSPQMALALSENASSGTPVNVHIKVDTGMGRVGMIVRNNSRILEDIETICKLPNLRVQGIYTHFAFADAVDRTYTQKQIRLFTDLLADLKKNNRTFEFSHAANSAGIINFPESHFNMVRAGIAIYGCYPSNKKDTSKITLKPAMTLKSIITSVKDVPKAFCVSYGMTYKTIEKTRLASVPIGYADGFSRKFSSTGFMLVNGHKAPVVGRVCMDQTMIDVGDIPDVTPGDEVIIIGSQKNIRQTAEDLAQQIGTINYEIVSALTARVKKHYSGMKPDIITIIGKSNSGKTTLMEKLIAVLSQKGYKIGSVKHAHEGFEMDKKGKDSWRHKHAGASATLVIAPGKTALIKDDDTDPIKRICAHLSDMDLVLAEGFKSLDLPKIEIFRKDGGHKTPLALNNEFLIAFVTDTEHAPKVPVFTPDDILGIAAFLETRYLTQANL